MLVSDDLQLYNCGIPTVKVDIAVIIRKLADKSTVYELNQHCEVDIPMVDTNNVTGKYLGAIYIIDSGVLTHSIRIDGILIDGTVSVND